MGNPVRLVDPDGRNVDDYFDARGSYLGRDNASTNIIRIVNPNCEATAECPNNIINDDGSINRNAALSISSDLASLSFSTSEERMVLSNITTHYYRELGYQTSELSEGKIAVKIGEAGESMSVGLTPEGQREMRIKISESGHILDSELADKYNLMNTTVHEKFHFDNHYQKQPDGTYLSLGTRINVPEEAARHVDAYVAQVEHATWRRTTGTYRDNTINKSARFYFNVLRGESFKMKEQALQNALSRNPPIKR